MLMYIRYITLYYICWVMMGYVHISLSLMLLQSASTRFNLSGAFPAPQGLQRRHVRHVAGGAPGTRGGPLRQGPGGMVSNG